MRLRIRDILLVSSLYDLYLFEEDGRLYELIRHEYLGLQLSHSPELTRVSTAKDAIMLAEKEKRFDLIITTLHVEDMHAVNFAKLIKKKKIDIPIVLLAFDNRELKNLLLQKNTKVFDNIFIWQGDYRIIIAIIKSLEDKLNLEHDTKMIGVNNIIVIEDNVRYYSSFMPIIYSEVLNQSRRLISEGINITHRFLRMRSRPKILLCSTYEEASKYFNKYGEYTLGIISDVAFPRKGELDPKAGLKFSKHVKKIQNDIPILLLSDNDDNRDLAQKANCSFILKNSELLLEDLRQFMIEYFSFGDFVFRTKKGIEVGRAKNLKSMAKQIGLVPEESIEYHSARNHFSNWFKARSEFQLAHSLRPRKVTDYKSIEDLRIDLQSSLNKYIKIRQRGIITEFVKEQFDPQTSFARIGGGSLGGKARGLGFINSLINDYNITDQFENVIIHIPAAIVLATDIFTEFIETNNLKEFALHCKDDKKITDKFLAAKFFPEKALGDLAAFLNIVQTPLAIRSSSLLEDSQYHPFAGVYQTYMIPNNHNNSLVRLDQLLTAIKKVYASTFYQGAKDYIKLTTYRSEEEKMAVIIQKMIGEEYENKFYPNFSGVARSYNFYPIGPQKSEDGIVNVALGLGKTVVDGGRSVRFCPKYPTDLIQFYSAKDSFEFSQRDFYALQLDSNEDLSDITHDTRIRKFSLEVSEKDGTLNYVGSTYSHENDIIYDGIARSGSRLVTFSQVLKHKIFPLAEILDLLLDMAAWGMGSPVEIEFAVNLNLTSNKPKEFGLLQMRPLVLNQEMEELETNEEDKSKILCESSQVMGHGLIENLYDIVYVDYNKYDRAESRKVAHEVSQYNSELINKERPYLLIGVGRWGSLDPWLGIPVEWDQIAGARVIVESSFKDIEVTPSQGSHFFQNLTSFMVGYFSVGSNAKIGFIDWDWLLSCNITSEKKYTKHIQLENPITIKMNGKVNKGIILKPEIIKNG
ncbi:MAG: histidine kinase [Ignavibacteriae bacterium]|nr:histidine kinase [Ignavibacteriota bacterium]